MRSPNRRLGEFEQLVLFAVLELQDQAYGVSIRDAIERKTGTGPAIGAVYTALDRLEARRLVSWRLGEPEAKRGGRRKKYFRLEPVGREALRSSFRALQLMAAGLAEKLEEEAIG